MIKEKSKRLKVTLAKQEINLDEEPLIEEELRQLNSDAGYITGEVSKHEFGLQVDLP